MNGQGNPQSLMVDHDGGWVPTAIAMADLENTDLLLKVQDPLGHFGETEVKKKINICRAPEYKMSSENEIGRELGADRKAVHRDLLLEIDGMMIQLELLLNVIFDHWDPTRVLLLSSSIVYRE